MLWGSRCQVLSSSPAQKMEVVMTERLYTRNELVGLAEALDDGADAALRQLTEDEGG